MNQPTPADTFIKDASSYKAFLRVFLGIMLINSMLIIGATVSAPSFDIARMPLGLFTIVVIATSWWLLDKRPRYATLTLVAGLWVAMAITTAIFAGIHSANMIMYPFLIALSGWVLGKRWLVTLTLATLALMVLVALAELLGLMHPTPRAPVLLALALNTGAVVALAFVVHLAYANFQESQQRAIDMSEQLGQHNVVLALREAEVRELNDTLELRVSERTTELAAAMETLHRAQEELLQSEAKAALGAMVASCTHELNTPLGNSVMAASTLGDQAKEFLRNVEAGQLKRSELTAFLTALRDGTDMIQRNLRRAETLLGNFKQVAADQTSEQRRQFDLAHCIGDVVAMLQPQLKRSPHRIDLRIADGLTLDSYPGPLGQVVINLINNAYLHAFEAIAQGTLTISADAGADHVTLHITDNGVGMTHDTLTRLFQPFFSTKIGKGGTGLGMTIVEGIVRKTLGGSLHVDSEPGKGSHFSITIPRIAPEI